MESCGIRVGGRLSIPCWPGISKGHRAPPKSTAAFEQLCSSRQECKYATRGTYAYADRRVPAPRHGAVHENNDGMEVSSHLQSPEHFLLLFLVVLHDQGRLEEPGPLVKSRLQLLEEVALLRLSGVF